VRWDTSATNPTSGAQIAVSVTAPQDATKPPLLILVPGGLSAGSLSFGVSGIADRYAQRGYAVLSFDADGRGGSDGIEDYGGPVHQDALAAVITLGANLPDVDVDRIGLVSFGLGAAMAAGALARHPALPIRLYVDWEGPALRQHVERELERELWKLGIDPPASCADDDWWRQREPARFLPQVSPAYQRVQGAPDHAQADPGHALKMIRCATATVHGGEGQSRWTRLNGNPPNHTFGPGEHQPWWLPSLPAEIAVFAYLVELLPPSGGRWGIG
jgi:pimeloyl-ACP methyl ester carboxylesterase